MKNRRQQVSWQKGHSYQQTPCALKMPTCAYAVLSLASDAVNNVDVDFLDPPPQEFWKKCVVMSGHKHPRPTASPYSFARVLPAGGGVVASTHQFMDILYVSLPSQIHCVCPFLSMYL